MAKIKIDKSVDVTSRLPFKPFPQFHNMCPGYLTSVEVTTSEVDADSKWEYAGMVVPRISFHFTEHKDKTSDPDRYFTHSELPISHVKVNGEDVTEKNLALMYTESWKRMKHIHDQFEGTANFKKINFDVDIDTNMSIEDRVKWFTKFYNDFAKAFNIGKDKENPIYSPKDLLLLKLVATGKKLSYLGFPTFVGTGFIQKVNIVNGKIETTLSFRANEGVELGATASIADAAPAGGGAPTLPGGLAEKLGLT